MKPATKILFGVLYPLSIAAGQVLDDVAKKTFEKVCGTCHETEVVTSQRHTRREWQSVTDDMPTRGAEGTPDELHDLQTWLARHYGKVRINNLTAVEIEKEMELSSSDAQSLVNYRLKLGHFKDFEALKAVPAVEASKLDRYKDSFVY
jgi:competence ComEA-like helix-hairpin-helix protein